MPMGEEALGSNTQDGCISGVRSWQPLAIGGVLGRSSSGLLPCTYWSNIDPFHDAMVLEVVAVFGIGSRKQSDGYNPRTSIAVCGLKASFLWGLTLLVGHELIEIFFWMLGPDMFFFQGGW